MKSTRTIAMLTSLLAMTSVQALEKPNIIVYFADDISARELPIYGSSVWTDPLRENTSDSEFRAKTPVLDKLAMQGCWIKTA